MSRNLAYSTAALVLAVGVGVGGVYALKDDDASTATPNHAVATETFASDEELEASGEGTASPSHSSTSSGWEAVAKDVRASVVSIQVQGQMGGGEGSGVVYKDGNYIVTNHHVIAAGQSAQYRVITSTGRVFTDVSLVGSDPATDLAVLKVEGGSDVLAAATFGDSEDVAPGAAVMAVGNPLGLADTVTTGIVSAVDRPVITPAGQQQSSEPAVTNAIQTDAAINPGNSGGALLNAQGEVIGINSSIAAMPTAGGNSGNIGLGFAIPANEAVRVADSLIQSGSVQHAWLGVALRDSVATVQDTSQLSTQIMTVAEGSPAAEAGLVVGDQVVSVEGRALKGTDSLVARIREEAPGTPLELGIVREGQRMNVTVQLSTKE